MLGPLLRLRLVVPADVHASAVADVAVPAAGAIDAWRERRRRQIAIPFPLGDAAVLALPVALQVGLARDHERATPAPLMLRALELEHLLVAGEIVLVKGEERDLGVAHWCFPQWRQRGRIAPLPP